MDGITRGELTITIFHVGGEGSYGPIESVISQFPKNVRLVVFDAREDTEDIQTAERLNEQGVPVTVVNRCITDKTGKSEFRVNKWPLSSSIFPPSPSATEEHVAYPGCHTWGQNTEVERVLEVDTVSLDELVSSGEIPPPDVISMDAQGAELLILRGASECLVSHVLAVVSEVEFHEIYAGQGLFCDQMKLLDGFGFRLADIVNTQYWHPSVAIGKGFLTVGEAVSLRRLDAVLERPMLTNAAALVRLACIASGFARSSYVYRIAKHLEKHYPRSFAQMREIDFLSPICSVYDRVERDAEEYAADSRYFLNADRAPAAGERTGIVMRFLRSDAGRRITGLLKRI